MTNSWPWAGQDPYGRGLFVRDGTRLLCAPSLKVRGHGVCTCARTSSAGEGEKPRAFFVSAKVLLLTGRDTPNQLPRHTLGKQLARPLWAKQKHGMARARWSPPGVAWLRFRRSTGHQIFFMLDSLIRSHLKRTAHLMMVGHEFLFVALLPSGHVAGKSDGAPGQGRRGRGRRHGGGKMGRAGRWVGGDGVASHVARQDPPPPQRPCAHRVVSPNIA